MYPLLNIDDTYSASSDIAKEIFEELAPMLWPYRTPLMRSIDLPIMRLSVVDTEHGGFVLYGWTWSN